MNDMLNSTQHTAHSTNSLNDLKLLSVIIPAYNTAKFLNKCVDSVVNQTYQNIEIIIVDDGSSDSTPQICDELASKYNNIKVIHQENKGLAQTRSVGFNASRGEYIAFVDSDDYIDLNAYAKAIKVLEDNDADMVMFGVKLVDLDEKILAVWTWDNKIFSTPRDVFKFFAETEKPNWGMPYKIYKRSLFENISWPKISMAEDY
ncbi:MAG: glycosyltransferase family 2 protein, partial [Synergistaceae bacterium]|nr:glycosyltransferase family 2 protein [Synergistaceae bacterium]